MSEEIKESLNFIETFIEEDLASGKHESIVTRFPPEPNGYLHIGHAKSICLNFGLTQKYKGRTNLRFDDTNPTTEDVEYVDSIKADIKWLGFEWSELHYASDYFEQIYDLTLSLIERGLAYIDDSTPEEIAALKGNLYEVGKNSPYRDRSVAENLDLFKRMRAGEFGDGTRVLRAKIDMAHPNLLMRDPVIYRIKHAHHHQTGDKWCIYPMYDYAHPISDAIENITHSVCTLEFLPHRPFYDWAIANSGIYPSRQIEFARLNLNYTVMSKRKLMQLVNENLVNGWNDPRMPTISGMRRRGYPAAAIREFAHRVGIAKRDNIIDIALLEFCVREDLNKNANRMMAVLNPLKVVITNYEEGKTEIVSVENNPEKPEEGSRNVTFGREIWIEQEDFMENPPKKYFRLFPNGIVRLKGAYIIECEEVVKDTEGNILQVNCKYHPNSRSGQDESGLHPKGTLHWVAAADAATAEVRIYDRLFNHEAPDSDKEKSFKEFINPDSLKILSKVYVESALKKVTVGTSYQFLRHGYFAVDDDSTSEKLVFNRTVTLKDTWAKEVKKG